MEGDEREVGEAGADHPGREDVQPVATAEAVRACLRRLAFEVLRRWEPQARDEQHDHRDRRWDEEQLESPLVIHDRVEAALCTQAECERHEERSGEATELVHRLVQSVAPAATELLRRVGQHRVARRVLDRLSDALDEPDRHRDLPQAHEREEGEGEELHEVAEDRDAPVRVRLVRRVTAHEPEPVPDEFPGAGRDTHRRGARSEELEELADDAAAAFVGHVGEEARRSHKKHEQHRRADARATALCFGARDGRISCRHRTLRTLQRASHDNYVARYRATIQPRA